MKVRLHVKDSQAEWSEDHDFPWLDMKAADVKEQARAEIKRMMARFNNNLREGERARKVTKAKITGPSTKHHWEKTNLVTISKGGCHFDTCECLNCGVTGKRFTLGSDVIVDGKGKNKDVCKKGK